MNATQTTAKAQTETETSDDFSKLDANNFIRGQKYGCLIIRNTSQPEPIETVFLAVNRRFFRIAEVGPTQADRISRVERHVMSAALENARKNGHEAKLAAYGQSTLDLDSDIEFIKNTFELEDKDSKAKFGLSRDQLDEADDEHFDNTASPIGTSDVQGGGW